MTEQIIFLLIGSFVTAGVVGCLSGLAGQLYERRKWERRLLERSGVLEQMGEPVAKDRTEALQLAVEAMAVELERIGEGQRFVTKLLAERPRDATSSRSPKPGSVPATPRPTV